MARPRITQRMTPADRYVNRCVRMYRILTGLTQEQLGTAIGISHDQMFKYDASADRVSAGRLYTIAGVLGVPITHFYPRHPEEVLQQVALGRERLVFEFSLAIRNIKNERHLEALHKLAQALATS